MRKDNMYNIKSNIVISLDIVILLESKEAISRLFDSYSPKNYELIVV